MATHYFLWLAVLALAPSHSMASDPDSLQDFCVADPNSQVIVNGLVCKDPKQAQPADFFFPGLNQPGSTTNQLGSNVTLVSAANLPGLNALGISVARLDFAPYGLIPPHYHPRATEILTLLEGTLYVGFVTSFPDFRLISKILKAGDVFVFPKGLVHFQFNQDGTKPAVSLSGLSSQNPGLVTVANAVFGSNPPIWDDVLAKAFQLDKKTVDWLQAQF
uniref:Germin-like protein n=1 Tax=Lilium regale TaxID=82328 RepID=A0A0U3C747_LILRE|nr:germin-like protein [Lilium regale]